MKRMVSESKGFLWSIVLLAVAALSIVGCGGGGGGGGGTTGGGATTTTISGKVTLSSTISGKPRLANNKVLSNLSKARAAGKAMKSGYNPATDSRMEKILLATGFNPAGELGSAVVELYDADHPEWLYPVATTFTDSLGNYKIEKLCSLLDTADTDSLNATYGATYKCGDSIPVGKYTIIASKSGAGSTGGQVVAVQAVIKSFEGDIAGNDLVAQDSDAVPSITSMFGLSKNTDGTYGSTTTELPANAAIQVTFSMAMARESVMNAVSITPSGSTTAESGTWKISADLLSATFIPTSSLTTGTVYTVTVAGGKSSKAAKNVYGIAIASEVKGAFKAKSADDTEASAIPESPTEQTDVAITTPIRFAANEPLDVNPIAVTSSPSIGDKPFIQYVGKIGKTGSYNYVYEIVPAEPLSINTNYKISVSNFKDLAGNVTKDALDNIYTMSFIFKTEETSTGITITSTTTQTEIDAQVAVKDGFGKWVRALNDRSTTILSSLMTGDFFWISDPTYGPDEADINRDGRLSLNEFTGMLENWFKQLDMCGSTVSGEVKSITLNTAGTAAILKFGLTTTSANTSLSACSESGPESDLYAVLQNINGAWLMTNGSDAPITDIAAIPSKLALIETTAPADGTSYPEPTTQPLLPEFKWTATTWKDSSGSAQPFATYAVVVIDDNSRFGEIGWVGLVSGSSAAAGDALSAKFTPKSGWSGTSLYILSSTNSEAFGFKETISEFKAGGSYTWAIIGFKANTVANFEKNTVSDPLADLGGSSEAASFSVAGTLKEYTVVVKDAKTSVAYQYSDMMDGYDVGSASSVTIVVTAPVGTDTTGKKAYVDVYGYTYPGALSGDFINGVATVSNIPLSQKWNWITIGDAAQGTGNFMHVDWANTSFTKEFGIVTTGGAAPKIKITSVTGKKCDGTTATLTGPNDWGEYSSAEVCSISFTGTVESVITGPLNVMVWSDNGQGRTPATISNLAYTVTDLPVYTGWNSVEVMDNNYNYRNHMSVQTTKGSIYIPPITISSVTGGTMTSSMLNEEWWDVGSGQSVTLAGTMQNVSASCQPNVSCSGWNQSTDISWNVDGGQITTSSFSVPLTLYNGWNHIGLSDSQGNWYQVHIFSTSSSAYAVPNQITAVKDSLGNVLTADSNGVYNTISCSVSVEGTTTSKGNPLYASMYFSSSTTSISEYPSTQPMADASTGNYSITLPVYNNNGTNWIDVNDSNWYWAGVQVKTTGDCTPVQFAAKVYDGSTELTLTQGWYYDAKGASKVTLSGTAKAGKTIDIYVSGMYYDSYTIDGATRTTTAFSKEVPIYNGYNYISLTDGANWLNLTVYTTGGTTSYTEPFKITSVTSTDGTVVATDTTGYSYSGTATTITVNGTATKDGTGYWYGGGSSGTFTVASGTFSVNITLWYGYNYVDLYGPNGNWDGISFQTTGGTGAPTKIVNITTPKHNDQVTSTDPTKPTVSVTVSGTVDTTKITPAYVYGYVYDNKTYAWINAYWDGITDATTVASWGYVPLTYSNGAFSFSATVNSGNPTEIGVEACDANWTCNGQGIYVNNAWNYSEYFYKPGSKPSAKAAIARAHKAEFVKKMISNKPKARKKGR